MNEDKEKENASVVSDEQITLEILTRSIEIDVLLNKKMKSEALVLSLQHPPVGNKSDIIKVINRLLIAHIYNV